MLDREKETKIFSTLAVLKSNWEENKSDYLDNFKPFVQCCLECGKKTSLTVDEINQLIKDEFNLNIPNNTVKTLLGRLIKEGVCSLENRVYSLKNSTDIKSKLDRLNAEFIRKFNGCKIAITQFAKNDGLIDWSDDDSEQSLYTILKHYSFAILSSAINGSPIGEIPKSDSKHSYVISKFIAYVYKNDQAAFEYLVTVIKGGMLANSLIYKDASKVVSKFKNFNLYLDTRLILSGLGLHGKEEYESVRTLLDMAYGLGVSLKCFSHTFDECVMIMKSVVSKLAGGGERGYGPLYLHCISSKMSSGDLELEIATLERNIRRLHISIDKSSIVNPYQDFNEQDLENVVRDNISSSYDNDNAIIRDIKSIQGVLLYRKGRSYISFEESVCVFATTNFGLCKAADIFQSKVLNMSSVPIVMSDVIIGNLLWLKNPNIAPDLPLKELMAEAYAGMQPSPELWGKYLEEVVKLKNKGGITGDDLVLLTHSHFISNELMNITKGDASAISQEIVPESLKRIHEAITKDKNIELQQERHRSEWQGRRIDYICSRIGDYFSWFLILIFICIYVGGGVYSIPDVDGYKYGLISGYILIGTGLFFLPALKFRKYVSVLVTNYIKKIFNPW